MDLSKAFDCLPHDLVIRKLQAYGLDDSAVNLIKDYLSNRTQCVQLGNSRSSLRELVKGAPQGSIMGPLIFNIFLNDIFKFVKHCDLANYADDNTITYSNPDESTWRKTLEVEAEALVDWFHNNGMQANPDKFQAIAFGSKQVTQEPCFEVRGSTIQWDSEVKLLGVEIDSGLNFDKHVSALCRKAGNQINVLKRLGKILPFACRKVIYHTFIRSMFNFCPIVWHFCSITNTRKIEKVNYRALKFVYQDNDSDYDALLAKDESTTLHLSRLRLIAIEVFKIMKGLRPRYLSNLIETKAKTGLRCSLRYENLKSPNYNYVKYKNGFKYEGAQIWKLSFQIPSGKLRISENSNSC